MPSEILIDEDLVDQNIIEQIKKHLDCPITKRPNVDFNLNNAKNLM
jgi:DNA mismatch repair protein MutS